MKNLEGVPHKSPVFGRALVQKKNAVVS